MEFAIQKSTGAQKCSQRSCGEAIPAGELVFLTTTVAFGDRGSCFGYHPKCAQPDQVSSVMDDWDKVDGWEKMSEELKGEVKTAFEQVLKNKVKKVATPIKRKSEASTKVTTAKASKSSKTSTPAKPKEKPEKKSGGPKKALSAYMLFGAGERQNVIDQNGGADKVAPKEVMSLLGVAWKAADAETRKKYEDAALADKERYARQKAEFDKTGTYTKTPEEIALEQTRAEKLQISKEKAKQKAAASKKKSSTDASLETKSEGTGDGNAKEPAMPEENTEDLQEEDDEEPAAAQETTEDVQEDDEEEK